MENAVDALKIAFAVFIFIIAITITFSIISQAKSTADSVLYHSDETNFYEYKESGNNKNREVSVAEIIPTLYRYYQESIGVTIKLKDGNTTYTFDLSNKEDIFINKKLASKADREENLKVFIKNQLLNLPEDTKFEEEFVEIPITGGKKVYITYTEK